MLRYLFSALSIVFMSEIRPPPPPGIAEQFRCPTSLHVGILFVPILSQWSCPDENPGIGLPCATTSSPQEEALSNPIRVVFDTDGGPLPRMQSAPDLGVALHRWIGERCARSTILGSRSILGENILYQGLLNDVIWQSEDESFVEVACHVCTLRRSTAPNERALMQIPS